MMELSLQEYLVIIAALLFFFYYWSTYTFDYWKKIGVPGPKPTPLLGNFGPIYLRQLSIAETLDKLYKEWKHEPFIGIFNSRLPILMVTDPDLVKNILIKDFNVFSGRGFKIDETIDPLAGHLFNIDGHRWKVLRSKLSPAFTTGKLKQMIDLMLECVEHFEKYLLEYVKRGEVIECREVAARFTTDVIGSCAFGIDMNALSREDSEFRTIGRTIFEPNFKNLLARILRDLSPWLYKFLGLQSISRRHTKFFMDSVRQTIDYRDKSNVIRHDLVDILRDVKKNQHEIDFELTEPLLASQAFVFFAAGFETSSTTISFALYELATVPETQDKLRAEILQVMKKHNGRLSYEIINEMKYLDMVLQETLRKDSPAILLRRKATEAYTIPGTNITIPKNTQINIPIYSFHYDERYYPNPHIFDPERFNEHHQRHPMVHLPFGDGPKNCIGLRFATYQSKLGIIAVIKNFRVMPSSTTKIPYKIETSSLILTPAGGVNLKFEPYSA